MRTRIIQTLVLLAQIGVASAEPIVIAHRGASGYLPEHTLEAYRLAIEQGADFIEPDLVVTRDGVLVARHDIYLGSTTDVASRPMFADRRKTVDGRSDWFVEDFTLDEVRQLRAVQGFGDRTRVYDGRYRIPTFQEIIDLVLQMEEKTGRSIGLYPETKSPQRFESLGHDMRGLVLDRLEANNLNRADADIFIQSFEPGILRALDQVTDVRLIMLVSPASEAQPYTPNVPLDEVATFADGIGAMKWLLMRPDGESSGVVERAKSMGLLVHAWTFRDDQVPPMFDSIEQEVGRYLDLGIDGFFTDFPDTGVAIRDRRRD